jgi:D-3-phosphoglycerate dehydrogenase
MRILVASAIDQQTIDRLGKKHEVTCAFNPSREELHSLVPGQHVLIFRSGITVSREILDAADQLKLVIRAGSGLDNLDTVELQRRDIPLLRIPRPASQAVAELSFALMLALARNVLRMDGLLRHGCWAKHHFENHLLWQKTLGIVGLGNIGHRVAQMGAAWGMGAIGCRRSNSMQVAAQLRREGIELTDFGDVLARSDFVSVHVPLSEDTRHLIDAEALARMKPGAFLVNTARGGVVDEEALYEALRAGHLRGAALDVHAEEGPGKLSALRELPNVVLTPHVGSSTVDTQREIGREILSIVEAFSSNPSHEETRAVG